MARSCIFIFVLCLAIAVQASSSSSSASRWRPRPIALFKKMHNPIASRLSAANRSTSAVKQHYSFNLWQRLAGKRKQLTDKVSTAGSKLINLSDPLHAYPNALDKAFHRVFNRVALYEVNNADSVRSLINTARNLSLFSLIATALGVALGVAIPVGVAAAGKRVDTDDIEYDDTSERWRIVNQMAQTVISAIQSGQLKYNV